MGASKLTKQQYTSITVPHHPEPPRVPKEPSFLTHLLSRNSILARLLFSLLPPVGSIQRISIDYEGSALNVFLLACVLFNRFGKLGVESGSSGFLMAVFLPILYVIIFSASITAITSCTRTNITLREVICMTCYGLFGHTLTLVLSIISTKLFIPSLIIFGGLSSLRICGLLLLRTRLPPLRFVVCTPASVTHLLFLVYLHVTVTG